jgi:hypothetical protein
MRCKVALFGPKSWAIGSINLMLKKHLQKNGFDVKVCDWGIYKESKEGLDWCDVFITPPDLLKKIVVNLPYEYKSKGMYVWHSLAKMPGYSFEDSNNHFFVKIPVQKNLQNNYFGITKNTADSVEKTYGVNAGVLPIGVDTEFWSKRSITRIKKIGHVIDPNNRKEQYVNLKRPWLFKEIAEKAGLDHGVCFGKSVHTGSYIYSDFDAIVNTSTHEGLPTPLLECAAAKIPFISTSVGIVPKYASVKTFETSEEAAEILKELNSDPDKLKKYVDDVYEDVAMSNLWSDHVTKHYIPAIEKILENK